MVTVTITKQVDLTGPMKKFFAEKPTNLWLKAIDIFLGLESLAKSDPDYAKLTFSRDEFDEALDRLVAAGDVEVWISAVNEKKWRRAK